MFPLMWTRNITLRWQKLQHDRLINLMVSLPVTYKCAYVTHECRAAGTWHSQMLRSFGISGEGILPCHCRLLTPTYINRQSRIREARQKYPNTTLDKNHAIHVQEVGVFRCEEIRVQNKRA